MRWYYEGDVPVTNPETKINSDIYIDASGTINNDDFEIDSLKSYYEDGNERELQSWEESEIEYWLYNNDELYQQAYEHGIDDAYDRYNDR